MVKKKNHYISNRFLYTLITVSMLVILGVGVYATTTISDSSIATSILNSTTDVFAYYNLNLTIPYYLATNGTFVPASILNNGTYSNVLAQTLVTNNTFAQLSQLNNGTYAIYQFVGNNFNGTGYFNTSGQVNGSTLYASGLNLTIPYLLATNNTFDQLSTLNNGSYFAWGNLGNGTVAFYNFTANNFNGTGYFNTSGQVNGSTVYSGLRNLTIPYYLATNGTFITNNTSNLFLQNNLTMTGAGAMIILPQITLPACASAYNGSIARNVTGGLFYCNLSGIWAQILPG